MDSVTKNEKNNCGKKPQKDRRVTVGNRLNSVSSESANMKNKKNEKENEPEPPESHLEEITHLVKACNIESKNDVRNTGTYNQQKDHELHFDPPWGTKIGQLQQVVRALHRHTDMMLENRGSVIVRCYPYKSATYMHLVYNLIYATLASSGRQCGGPSQAPVEIRPILLQYDDNGMPNPIHQPAAPFGIPQFVQQPAWTDVVLVRVRFANQEAAINFLQSFNRTVGRVFDRRQVRAPFAHPDLTQPERILRHRLQQICLEKNRTRQNMQQKNFNARNRFNQQQQYRYNSGPNYRGYGSKANEERYSHNGMQMFKEYSNGQNETVPWEPYTELQYLHVVVASLRKYATMFKQKESFVIIQNIDEGADDDNRPKEADTERITALVYNIVTTETFRQRCQALQEQNNGPLTANASPFSPITPNACLPMRIERLSRSEIRTETTDSVKIDKQEPKSGEIKENSEILANKKQRPRLVRIQFQCKEAAVAFCQIFKEVQKEERQKKKSCSTEQQHNTDEQEEQSGRSCVVESCSDLSELEVVNGGMEQKAENKCSKQLKQLFFPDAFAHRDLTPPELALGYALRQFCRERNRTAAVDNHSKSNENGTSDEKELKKNESNAKTNLNASRFYIRAGRIFERTSTFNK